MCHSKNAEFYSTLLLRVPEPGGSFVTIPVAPDIMVGAPDKSLMADFYMLGEVKTPIGDSRPIFNRKRAWNEVDRFTGFLCSGFFSHRRVPALGTRLLDQQIQGFPGYRELASRQPTQKVWHWVHGLLLTFLGMTGLQLRFPDLFPIFAALASAVGLHSFAGILLSLDYFFWFAYRIRRKNLGDHILIPQKGPCQRLQSRSDVLLLFHLRGTATLAGLHLVQDSGPAAKGHHHFDNVLFPPWTNPYRHSTVRCGEHEARHNPDGGTEIDRSDSHSLCLPFDRIGHNSLVHKQPHEKNRSGTCRIARQVLKMGLGGLRHTWKTNARRPGIRPLDTGSHNGSRRQSSKCAREIWSVKRPGTHQGDKSDDIRSWGDRNMVIQSKIRILEGRQLSRINEIRPLKIETRAKFFCLWHQGITPGDIPCDFGVLWRERRDSNSRPPA